MWDVRATLAGEERELARQPAVLEGGEALMRQVPLIVRGWALPEAPLETLFVDLLGEAWTRGQVKPGADFIQRWANEATQAFVATTDDRFLVTEEGALEWQDARGRTLAVAWHDESAVVVPVNSDVGALEFRYSPDRADAERAASLVNRYRLRDRVSLDWTGYFGTQSEKIEGDKRFGRLRQGWRRAVVGTAEKAGVVVGKVVHVLGQDLPSCAEDPDQPSRLQGCLSDLLPAQPSAPDLAEMADGSVPGPRCAIFIHGTLSCGIPNGELLASVPEIQPLYRFEHDTFHEIIDNATLLRNLIVKKVRPGSGIVLLCHSRGGIVGRRTAQLMRDDPFGLHVLTFGTPHEGTPLVNAATRSLGMLYKLGAATVGSASRELPVSAAFRYMLSSGKLPPGIAAMTTPPSGVLKDMNASADRSVLASFAGDGEGPDGPRGVRLAFNSAVSREAFAGARNDLVVAVSSATARAAIKVVVPSCTHSEYFLPHVWSVRRTLASLPRII